MGPKGHAVRGVQEPEVGSSDRLLLTTSGYAPSPVLGRHAYFQQLDKRRFKVAQTIIKREDIGYLRGKFIVLSGLEQLLTTQANV